ncbi:MAG: choice-of-anchor D domain-containing protein, partial [Candidatus Kryptonium sp.]|nr:choice-of-anchor D domain-containing protein [Candidatus Kryptonium sp.]
LPSNYVWSITIDGQGNKWIGTNGGGLAVYREGGIIMPFIQVNKTNISFGNKYIGRTVYDTIVVNNRGVSNLTISDIKINNQVFRYIGTLPLVVAPNGSANLVFSFSPIESRVYVDTIRIVSNSVVDSVLSVVLTGRGVRPPYVASSVDTLKFGNVVVLDSLTRIFWIYNRGEMDTVRISSILVERPFYYVGSVPVVIRPGDSVSLSFRFKPDTSGEHKREVRILSNAWNDTFRVYLSGVGIFTILNRHKPVQSNIVKLVYRVGGASSFNITSFEYSTDGGRSWISSSNIRGRLSGIGDNSVDTIYWESKRDLPSFEGFVRVRAKFNAGGFEYFVYIDSVGVDNLAPRFLGIRTHRNLSSPNKVVLYWDRAVDISRFHYDVYFSETDTFDITRQYVRTSVDSALISGLKTSVRYRFWVKVEDEHGQYTVSSVYQGKVSGLCDYNGDNKVDAFDLGRYVKSWTDRNYSEADIYPYSGVFPFVVVVGDGKLDVNDVFTFTRIWDYSHIRGLPKVVRYDSYVLREEIENLDGKLIFRPEVHGEFISYGVEVHYGDVRVDSFVALREGINLVYRDSLSRVIYFDYSKSGGIVENGEGLFRIVAGGYGDDDSLVVKFFAYDESSLESGKVCYEKEYVYRFVDLPKYFELYQNYPNPFNPATHIKFDLPRESYVKILVYDVVGRLVKVVFEGELQAGRHLIRFDANDLPSGVYFYRIVASNQYGDKFVKTRKMVLVK